MTGVSDPKGTRAHRTDDRVDRRFGSAYVPDRYLVLAYCCVIAGAWLGTALWSQRGEQVFMPASEYSAFALLFIIAQAVERIVEPIANYADAVMDKANAIAEAAAADKRAKARSQAKVDQIRQNLALITWGVASLAATTTCGAFGVLLFRIIGGSQTVNVPGWVDITITGLVVGAGTKPLHDLISYVQKAKDARGSAAAAVAAEASL